jgi:hypothetical protein
VNILIGYTYFLDAWYSASNNNCACLEYFHIIEATSFSENYSYYGFLSGTRQYDMAIAKN